MPGRDRGLAPSNICAVDPETFEIYDDIDVPENAVSPFSITMFEGRIAIYVTTIAKAYRYFWDPRPRSCRRIPIG